jgi:hypothetical protein
VGLGPPVNDSMSPHVSSADPVPYFFGLDRAIYCAGSDGGTRKNQLLIGEKGALLPSGLRLSCRERGRDDETG